jgi:hypothetical protein
MPENDRNLVFISYRRDDAKHLAGRIRDELRRSLGDRAEIFLDVTSTQLGSDYRVQIERALDRSRVMIVLIGENWLDASAKAGAWASVFPWARFLPWAKPARRLDDPDDLVRQEIRTGLEKRPLIMIIPVIADRARMPAASELPEPIRDLHYEAALAIRHEEFDRAVPELVRAVLRALEEPVPVAPAPVKSEPQATAAAPSEKLVSTPLAERRQAVLANLTHLRDAAVTRDPDLRKGAHLQYVTTLAQDYVKDFGHDRFSAATDAACTELDAWSQDQPLNSRASYFLPAFAITASLAAWAVYHFHVYHGLHMLFVDEIGAAFGNFFRWLGDLLRPKEMAPYPSTFSRNPIVRLVSDLPKLATVVATAFVWLMIAGVLQLCLNAHFLALYDKWRTPNCDADLARLRAQLDAPAVRAAS